MDFYQTKKDEFGTQNSHFIGVTGQIVDMVPTRIGGNRSLGCVSLVTIEDMDGNIVNFVMSPLTYVVNFETLKPGMLCTFWYETQAPALLIFPPQYNAVVAAVVNNIQMIDVDYYDSDLVNASQSLQIHTDASVEVRTTNNQIYQGSLAEHNLIVEYENSTRSIPAQTTPKRIVVLCDWK